jgi:fatty acid desaturase
MHTTEIPIAMSGELHVAMLKAVPKETRDAIAKFAELDNWHAVWAVCEDWLIILLSAFASELAFAEYGVGVLSICIYAAAVIVIGCRMRGLAALLHDATHGVLARNKIVNFVVGTLLSGYLVGQSFTVYHESHILRHHACFGTKDDPDFQEMIQWGLYDSAEPHLPASAAAVGAFLRNIVFNTFR